MSFSPGATASTASAPDSSSSPPYCRRKTGSELEKMSTAAYVAVSAARGSRERNSAANVRAPASVPQMRSAPSGAVRTHAYSAAPSLASGATP